MSIEAAHDSVALTARGITQSGLDGPVYGPIDLDVPAGGVTVLAAPAGPGRTAFQLTLAGRMKPKSGTLSVFGEPSPKRIFNLAAVGGINEVDLLYSSARVRDLITEKLRWDSPWYRLVRGADDAVLSAMCGPVFGELPLPGLNEYVYDLREVDTYLLRIALANSVRPPLLVAGNLDQLTNDADQRIVLERLVDLGREQTVITMHANPAALPVGNCRVVQVRNLTHQEIVHGEGAH